MLKLTATNSFYVFDSYSMLVVKSDSLSWRDSIGMTVCAWIAYEMPRELESGLDACIINGRKITEHRLLRHPHYKEDASRDHWSYMLIYLKLWGGGGWYNSFVKFTPFMRGLYLWMHALTGNRVAEWGYYFLNIPGAYLGNGFLQACRWIGRIKPERDNNWWIKRYIESYKWSESNGNAMLYDRTRWQKFWAWVIFQIIPAYPLHNKGWQLYVMPDSKKKEKLKRILLKRIGKSNIMLRLLFGDTMITQQDVDNYRNMTGYRPGVYLDETCRRTIRELTEQEAEFNTYEVDLIKWLYKNKI